MATEIEYEKTYLLKYIPEAVKGADSSIIRDTYIPESVSHAHLRLRDKDNSYVITKKQPVEGNNSSIQYEHTIQLDRDEYESLVKCSGKDFVKTRFFVELAGRPAELDIYGEKLSGLVVVDFEFANADEMAEFSMPDFCLADVTQDSVIAGGYLAGKSYADIADHLKTYGYKKIEEEI